MTADPWEQVSFPARAMAQADAIAALSAAERVALLEELLAIAEASGALHAARADKQRALDALWGS